ncbi:UNVERIFIED_CONTAM: hypothetical protein GTU68_052586 [Idotea baltica]|nr:hypothetical protein [Idotea baltica]
MWLFAMFDLPVTTKEARREYSKFRNLLLDEGFGQLQYSIYARYCGSDNQTETYRRRMRIRLPSDGHIRLLSVTDRQFGKMEVFRGSKRVDTENKPTQLQLF